MISGIDSQSDIVLYLESKELEELSSKTIDGILIKECNPKKQGTISISVDDSKKDKNGFGVGIDDTKYWGFEKFHIDVYIGSEYYQNLCEKKIIGTRTRMMDGSKIHIYDRSNFDDCTKTFAVEQLEFYRDNLEKLLD